MKKNNFYLEWRTHPVRKHVRGKLWYLLIIIAVFAFLAYGIFDQNWSLIFGVVVLCIVYIVIHRQETQEVDVVLSRKGLQIGNRRYRFSKMSHFWIFHELNELHVRLEGAFSFPVSIEIPEDHIEDIEDYMKYKVPEYKTKGEMIMDAITYFFKL